MGYLDALVPATPSPRDLLERLRQLGIRDGVVAVAPGPLDEATLNLVRRVIISTGRHLFLELPQGKHDLAVMLGVYLQLMRLGARMQGQFSGEGFGGAVVVIGLNTNLTDRLRRIKIGSQSLSEALSARRIRADGSVVDLRGHITSADVRPDPLLYLNTSLGWPSLGGVHVGVAVIDRTSFRNVETLNRALAWCERHQASQIVVLSALGDVPPTTTSDNRHWVRWGWTPGLRAHMAYELGDERSCGPLSTNSLLAAPPRPVGTALYRAPELSTLRRACLRSVSAARKVDDGFPKGVAEAVQLLSTLAGLWGRVETANVWAALEPRGMTINTLARNVRGTTGTELRGPWALFRETHWPDLRHSVLRLTDLLTEYNPRFDVLLALLDWAAATRPGLPVRVRVRSRPAAGALAHDLADERPSFAEMLHDERPGDAALSVVPYSERLPWSDTPAVEFHLGVPPPWLRGALLSGEACEHVVVLDEDEQRWLNTVLDATNHEWCARLGAAAAALNFLPLPEPHIAPARTVFGPLGVDSRGLDHEHPAAPTPGIDLDRLFAAFSAAVARVDHDDEDGASESKPASGGRPALARGITLEPDGAIYWLPWDTRVEVLAGRRYCTVAVSAVTAGVALLIPRGEGRDELYQRLLRAAYQEADVMAAQRVLRRFRLAMHELHDRFGSWEDVARQLRHSGSSVEHGSTCSDWASGDAIAPDDVWDIRRVVRLTYTEDLLVDRAWVRISAIADELRRLHRNLGRLLSAAISEAAAGEAGPNLRRLSELCGGIDTTEILEEFDVRQVRAVSRPASVPSSQLRRLLLNTPAGAEQPA
jgi:hypothetical protein